MQTDLTSKKGQFISFEGIDGAGKTTQIKYLADRLEALGQPVIMTREPGGNPEAETIRSLILEPQQSCVKWLAETEVLLMYAARLEHVQKKILPYLQKGYWVLSDRFADSTRVYQGYAGGVSLSYINSVHRLVLGEFETDLSFIFDLDIEISQQRLKERQEKITCFENRNLEFQHAIRNGFLDLVKHNPKRCIAINATEKKQYISEKIWSVLTQCYPVLNQKEV